YDLERGRVARELKFDFDAVGYPAFAPDGKSLAFEGLKDGLNDIYVVDLTAQGAAPRRLTHDAFDERDLCWAPDGRLCFASDRHAPLAHRPVRAPGGSGTYGIYSLDVAGGAIREVLFTGHDDSGPAWSPDGRRLAFISQRNHSQNLYVFTPGDSTVVQVTDVI